MLPSLLDVKNFRDKLILTFELMAKLFGNIWWDHLKNRIRDFAVNYSCIDGLVAQRKHSNLDRKGCLIR